MTGNGNGDGDAPCVPESDVELCAREGAAREGATCESHVVTDGCVLPGARPHAEQHEPSVHEPQRAGAPKLLPHWQHKPLADCSKIVAMASPGGCQNEDVVLMTRQ